MKIVNTLGRAVVGTAFMMFGYEAVKEPGGRVQAVEALGVPQPELAVRVNGAAMIAGGAALATGICARTGAAGLALALVPTSLAGHPYWKESDDSKRFSEIIHFRKNMALAGALAAYAFRK
ncbi:MAG TPA: DoxX family membrane protein [Candidatus Yaniella excrementigallinarum]|nr:DoxX family membrane protein [Candidatus Yaniella excrementigallinarum]